MVKAVDVSYHVFGIYGASAEVVIANLSFR